MGLTGRGRVWLVGESNPYGSDPRFALYPAPERSAGARLCAILGLHATAYLRGFERRNLLQLGLGERWSVRRARAAASALAHDLEVEGGAGVVLLGARVSEAFGIPFREWLFKRVDEGLNRALYTYVTPTVVLPHPSGLARDWNPVGGTGRAEKVSLARDLVFGLPGAPTRNPFAEAEVDGRAARGLGQHEGA